MNETYACENTDRELYREPAESLGMSAYSPSLSVTKQGGIQIHVGGLVFCKTLREWMQLAKDDFLSHPENNVKSEDDSIISLWDMLSSEKARSPAEKSSQPSQEDLILSLKSRLAESEKENTCMRKALGEISEQTYEVGGQPTRRQLSQIKMKALQALVSKSEVKS